MENKKIKYGFNAKFILADDILDEEFDEWLDDLIDVVEKNGLIMGGGGKEKYYEVAICKKEKDESCTEKDRETIRKYAEDNAFIKTVEIGELIDIEK